MATNTARIQLTVPKPAVQAQGRVPSHVTVTGENTQKTDEKALTETKTVLLAAKQDVLSLFC